MQCSQYFSFLDLQMTNQPFQPFYFILCPLYPDSNGSKSEVGVTCLHSTRTHSFFYYKFQFTPFRSNESTLHRYDTMRSGARCSRSGVWVLDLCQEQGCMRTELHSHDVMPAIRTSHLHQVFQTATYVLRAIPGEEVKELGGRWGCGWGVLLSSN